MKKLIWAICVLAISSLVNAAELYSPPDGFTSICTLDENCAVDRSTLVAFGSDGDYVYKTLSGEFICAPATFDLPRSSTRSGVNCAIIDPLASSTNVASSSTSSAPIDNVFRIPNGDYALISRSSGKALTATKANGTDSAQVVQQNFEQQSHQIWHVTQLEGGYYSLSPSHSSKALENLDWDSKDGGELQQLPWINSWGQQWSILPVEEGYVKILSRTNNQALDVYEMNNKNNGAVVLWTYWGGENQQWRFVPVKVDAPTIAE